MGRTKSSPASGLAALLILCVVSLALFTLYVKEGDCAVGGECGPLHTVQLGAAEVLRPIRGSISTVAQPLGSVGDRAKSAVNPADEEQLQRRLRETSEVAAEVSRLRQENERLRGLLEGERTVYRYGPLARVIAPVGDQFTERVMIDVGTEDGIQADMPVVIGKSTLVGRTTQVSRNTSQVVLITDQMFAAGVRIVPPAEFDPASGTLGPAVTSQNAPYGQGLLQTDLEGNFEVDLVPLSSRAEEGDYVVTSGRASGRRLLFPPGLLVGNVESASSQDYNQFQNIVVEPAINPDDLEEMRVIVDW